MARRVIIYAACEPGTTTVRYIGKTIRPLHRRMKQHLYYSRNRLNNHTNCWFNSLAQAAQEPEMMVIRIVDEECWQYYEQFYIAYYRWLGYDLVNGTDGGEGTNGWTPSTETLARMRVAQKAAARIRDMRGPNNPWFGRHHTEESKHKLSQSKKGQGLGQKRSPQTRAKLSEKAKAREERRRQERIANGTYVKPHGRPRGERKALLTTQQRAEIHSALSTPGARRSLLAKQYGVSVSTIRRIDLGLTFRPVAP